MTLENLGISQLSIPERIELIGLLWDSVDAETSIPVPEWHIRELEKRRAAAETNPEAGVSWNEMKTRLMAPP